MKRLDLYRILLAVVTASYLSPANAQVAVPSITPSAPAPTSSLDVFPRLPQSTVCTKEKLIGIWKLLMVYEVPSGREIQLYTSNPLQYYVFNSDSRYGQYSSVLHAVTLAEVKNLAINNQRGIQQYSLNQSGVLYFYKDQFATDSMACFIVAANTPPFMAGQLLLMPPKKTARGRMVKVYQKMFLEFEPKVQQQQVITPADTDSEQ